MEPPVHQDWLIKGDRDEPVILAGSGIGSGFAGLLANWLGFLR